MSAAGLISVAAGAGTGKTRALTGHYVALVLAGTAVSRIVTVTFTDKAAEEMRQRIIGKLSELGRERERREVESAAIGTIHSLCGRILRENALAAGLDPGFGVADADRARLLFDQAFVAAAERFKRERFELHQGLRAAIHQPGQRASVLLREDRWTEAFVELFAACRQLPGLGLEWMAESQKEAEPLARLLAAAEAALSALERVRDPKYEERRELLRSALERLLSIDPEQPRLEQLALLGRIGQAVKGNVLKALREPFGAVKTTLVQAERLLADRWAASEVRLDLFLNEYVRAEYERVKRAAGVLDFDDLEQRAVALLQSDDKLRETLRRRWTHVLVDEFQDTSPLQFALVSLLAENNELFVVGDEKQSIYGFRGSDVQIIRQTHESAVKDGRRTLSVNWRSRPEVLAFVNRVFERMWGEGSANRMEPLTPTIEKAWTKRCGVRIRLVHGGQAVQRRRSEAEHTAECIARLINEPGFWGFEQPLSPGRIAVLARTAASLGPIQRSLAGRSIPFALSSGAGFFESWEVLDLANLLRCLALPEDEIALAAVLRSPLAGLSDQALLELCRHAHDRGLRLIDALNDPPDGLDQRDCAALAEFVAKYSRLRREARHLPPDELLARAAHLFEAELLALAGPEGARRAANVRRLLPLAADLASYGAIDPLRLADELVRLRAGRSTNVESAATEFSAQDSAVALMTVHKAKGLEFDAVFLIDVGRSPRRPAGAFIVQRELGAAFKLLDPAGIGLLSDARWKMVNERLSQDADAEEERLLYVAMTRARELLTISGTWSDRRRHWLDKLARALELPAEPGAGALDLPGCEPAQWSVEELVETAAPSDAQEQRAPEQIEPSAGALDRLQIIERPMQPEQRISSVSVTGLWTFAVCPRRFELAYLLGLPLDPLSDEPQPRAEQLAAPDSTGPDAYQWGNAVHALLQQLEPGADDAEIEALARRIGRSQFGQAVDERHAQRLARTGIEFARSELGRRIARADRLLREADVALRLHGLLIEGQIDLAFEEPAGWVLVDHKTERPGPGGAAGLADEYRVQLLAYRQALAAALGRPPVEALLNCVGHGAARIEFDDPQSELERLAAELAAAAAARRFPQSIGTRCERCRQRVLCRPGQPLDRA